ncbi:MAG: hypothetical protein HY903_15445 [Deltaproteobacteria bacterium]|nr:hypothetical protein [Deltaproteobacteria bacterium]
MCCVLLTFSIAAAEALACPTGAARKEQKTAAARETWCAKPDGTRHGPRHAWHQNGKPWFEGEYADGKRTGAWRFWFQSGAPMASATYADDKADGLMTRFFESGGKEMEGVCRAGEAHGRFVRYLPNGKEDVVATFDAGKVVGAPQYFSRRGKPVDLTTYLTEKNPGIVSGSDKFQKLVAAAKPEAVFVECRN